MKPFASRLQRELSFINMKIICAYSRELNYFIGAGGVRAWNWDEPLYRLAACIRPNSTTVNKMTCGAAEHKGRATMRPLRFTLTCVRLWNLEFIRIPSTVEVSNSLDNTQRLHHQHLRLINIKTLRGLTPYIRRFRGTYCVHLPCSHRRGNPKTGERLHLSTQSVEGCAVSTGRFTDVSRERSALRNVLD